MQSPVNPVILDESKSIDSLISELEAKQEDCQLELKNLLSQRSILQTQLLKLSSTLPLFTQMLTTSHHFHTTLHQSAEFASILSLKLKSIVVAQNRIETTLSTCNDIIKLDQCANELESMDSGDIWQQCNNIAEYFKVFNLIQDPTLASRLQKARKSALETVLSQIQEAIHNYQTSKVYSFLVPLFQLDQSQKAIDLYSSYLRSWILSLIDKDILLFQKHLSELEKLSSKDSGPTLLTETLLIIDCEKYLLHTTKSLIGLFETSLQRNATILSRHSDIDINTGIQGMKEAVSKSVIFASETAMIRIFQQFDKVFNLKKIHSILNQQYENFQNNHSTAKHPILIPIQVVDISKLIHIEGETSNPSSLLSTLISCQIQLYSRIPTFLKWIQSHKIHTLNSSSFIQFQQSIVLSQLVFWQYSLLTMVQKAIRLNTLTPDRKGCTLIGDLIYLFQSSVTSCTMSRDPNLLSHLLVHIHSLLEIDFLPFFISMIDNSLFSSDGAISIPSGKSWSWDLARYHFHSTHSSHYSKIYPILRESEETVDESTPPQPFEYSFLVYLNSLHTLRSSLLSFISKTRLSLEETIDDPVGNEKCSSVLDSFDNFSTTMIGSYYMTRIKRLYQLVVPFVLPIVSSFYDVGSTSTGTNPGTNSGTNNATFSDSPSSSSQSEKSTLKGWKTSLNALTQLLVQINSTFVDILIPQVYSDFLQLLVENIVKEFVDRLVFIKFSMNSALLLDIEFKQLQSWFQIQFPQIDSKNLFDPLTKRVQIISITNLEQVLALSSSNISKLEIFKLLKCRTDLGLNLLKDIQSQLEL